MASSWRRTVGNVRSIVSNSMGGLRGGSNLASWVVAGTLAYFLWVKPSQDLKRQQQEQASLAASDRYRYVETRKPIPDPQVPLTTLGCTNSSIFCLLWSLAAVVALCSDNETMTAMEPKKTPVRGLLSLASIDCCVSVSLPSSHLDFQVRIWKFSSIKSGYIIDFRLLPNRGGVKKGICRRCPRWEFVANTANRASNEGSSMHTGGSISMGEHARRMEVATQVKPSIEEVFAKCHLKKDNTWVDDRSENAMGNFKKRKSELSELSLSLNEDGDGLSCESQNMLDDLTIWKEVVPKGKKGTLYGLGSIGTNISSKYAVNSSSSASKDTDMEQELVKWQEKVKEQELINQEQKRKLEEQQKRIESTESLVVALFGKLNMPLPPNFVSATTIYKMDQMRRVSPLMATMMIILILIDGFDLDL